MTDTRELAPFVRSERATPTILNAVRVRPRTMLVTAALAIATVGVAKNWSALVAAGIAPLIITALPCVIMCALGLCMSRMGTSSCAAEAQSQQSAAETEESLQPNSLAGRISEPEPGNEPVGPRHLQAEARQQEHHQERRPINA